MAYSVNAGDFQCRLLLLHFKLCNLDLHALSTVKAQKYFCQLEDAFLG